MPIRRWPLFANRHDHFKTLTMCVYLHLSFHIIKIRRYGFHFVNDDMALIYFATKAHILNYKIIFYFENIYFNMSATMARWLLAERHEAFNKFIVFTYMYRWLEEGFTEYSYQYVHISHAPPHYTLYHTLYNTS
jgi:hypothetical protein